MWIRRFVFFCVVMGFAPVASAFEYYVVNKSSGVVNAPDSSDKIAQLKAGEVLLKIDEQGPWSKIFFLNNEKLPLKGWVLSQYLTAQNRGAVSVTANSEYYHSKVDKLRLRKGPGSNYKVMGSLMKQQVVKLISRTDGWMQVKYKDQMGVSGQAWVAERFMQRTVESLNKPEASSVGVSASGLSEVTVDRLNLRSGPGKNYRVIGKLLNKQKVEILEEHDEWQKIRTDFDGTLKTGWTVHRFLKPLK